MKIPIGHRKPIQDLLERLHAFSHDGVAGAGPSVRGNTPTEMEFARTSFRAGSMMLDGSIRDTVTNLGAIHALGGGGGENPALKKLQSTTHHLKSGFVWSDFEGTCDTIDEFFDAVQYQILRTPGGRDEAPPHFIRGFLDNKPMPFFLKSHTKLGKSCCLLLLRLPSTPLLVDSVSMKDSTMATMTNRIVFVYYPRSSKGGFLFTYHKDPTPELTWLQDVKSRWGELQSASREKLILHLVTEALMTNGVVLENFRMQLESLIEVRVSFSPKAVVEWMSLLNRQAQVMKRCLISNQSALESLATDLGIDAQTTLQVAQDFTSTAEEIEGNALDNMNLRMGLVGFRAQENMKFFTYMSAVTAPMTVLTGWYGMNFENMPELHFEESYYVFAGFAVVVLLGVMWLVGYLNRDVDSLQGDAHLQTVVKSMMSSVLDAPDHSGVLNPPPLEGSMEQLPSASPMHAKPEGPLAMSSQLNKSMAPNANTAAMRKTSVGSEDLTRRLLAARKGKGGGSSRRASLAGELK
eukprot:PhF_6_TR35393/c0_g1_i1/m.51470